LRHTRSSSISTGHTVPLDLTRETRASNPVIREAAGNDETSHGDCGDVMVARMSAGTGWVLVGLEFAVNDVRPLFVRWGGGQVAEAVAHASLVGLIVWNEKHPQLVLAEPEKPKPAQMCLTCNGDGYYKGPRLGDEPCRVCDGTGEVECKSATNCSCSLAHVTAGSSPTR